MRLLLEELEALLLPLGFTMTTMGSLELLLLVLLLELQLELELELCCGQSLLLALASVEPRLSLAVDLLSRLFVYLRLLVGVVDKSL